MANSKNDYNNKQQEKGILWVVSRGEVRKVSVKGEDREERVPWDGCV